MADEEHRVREGTAVLGHVWHIRFSELQRVNESLDRLARETGSRIIFRKLSDSHLFIVDHPPPGLRNHKGGDE